MPFQQTRLVNPTTLTTSASTPLYTVPAQYTAVIKQFVVTNTTGSARTFSFYIGSVASASTALFSSTSVAANDALVVNLSQVLAAGDSIFAAADAGSALNLTVSGVINDGPLEPTDTHIPDGYVTTSKLSDSSVTQTKLASGLSGITAVTSATRSTLVPSPFNGQTIYETDTKKVYIYDGSIWVEQTTSGMIQAKGDLLAGTGVDSGARLAVGANNQRLIADSTQTTGLRWAADTQNTVVTTKGDLLAGTSASTISRLGVGTNNQVLAADSATGTGLTWVDRPWNVHGGLRSLVTRTSGVSIGGETVVFTSSTFTAVANRYYRLTWFEPFITNSGALYSVMKFRLTNISGTIIGESLPDQADGNNPAIGLLEVVRTFTAGSTTVVATLVSTHTSTLNASANQIASFVIEDVGPV